MIKYLSICILIVSCVISRSFDTNILINLPNANVVMRQNDEYKSALTNGGILITTNEELEIKTKLEQYENGLISIEALNENAGDEGTRMLIGYYLKHTNDISTKAKIPISRSFLSIQIYPEAAKLATEYVEVFSNDWRGWHCLGSAYLCMDAFQMTNDMARPEISALVIMAYDKAVKLGDSGSIPILTAYALNKGNYDVVKWYVPKLLKLKRSKEDKEAVILTLIAYSINTKRKDVFIDTLKGENINELVRNKNLERIAEAGCKIFLGKDVDKIRKNIQAATQAK